MRQVLLFSLLLLAGMVGAQLLPSGEHGATAVVGHGLQLLTMGALAFIMIHVGYEFELDKTNLRRYGWDYLDTVVLMIPLKMLVVGLAWQLGAIVVLLGALLWVAWRYLYQVPLSVTWPWVLAYAVGLTGLSELLYIASAVIDDTVPLHIEILLPAFAPGCVLARPPGSDPHADDALEERQAGLESAGEQRVAALVAAVFMALVGLSLPPLVAEAAPEAGTLSAPQPMPGWGAIAGHVLLITGLANLGKMVPAVCYPREAPWPERLALAIGMWPRGEVGAGVLALSLRYGLGGPMVTVAMLSLALNLVLTGAVIALVNHLVAQPL